MGIQPQQLQASEPTPSILNKLDVEIEHAHAEGAWKCFADASNKLQIVLQRFQVRDLFMDPIHRGRGVSKLQKQKCSEPLVRHARHAEFEPTGEESTLLLRQLIRQIRRLGTLAAQLKAGASKLENESQRALAAAGDTWKAIVSARGFGSSFAEWWVKESDRSFIFQLPNYNMVGSQALEAKTEKLP